VEIIVEKEKNKIDYLSAYKATKTSGDNS